MDEKIKNHKMTLALELELAKRAHDRPSWESSNEGVHERVNFDDTIWGFNLAGGAYYSTPLRVTQVKEGSRAEHAGIKIGDVLQSINELDTSTLTLQEAHDIILHSGIEIKLALAAHEISQDDSRSVNRLSERRYLITYFKRPDVEETTHYIYQDEVERELRELKRQQSLKEKKKHKDFKGARVNDSWSSFWPCNKKRDIMYRESNCFMVPSKYEQHHTEKINSCSIATNETTNNVETIEE